MTVNQWSEACESDTNLYYFNGGLGACKAQLTRVRHEGRFVLMDGETEVELNRVFTDKKACIKAYIDHLQSNYLEDKNEDNSRV